MLGRKKNEILVKAESFPLPPDRIGVDRQCQGENCPRRATLVVFKFTGTKGGMVGDGSSRRFTCDSHATLALWPRRVRVLGLGRRWRGGRDAGRHGDMYDAYRTLVKEMGGVVPVPEYKKEGNRVKTCWPDRHVPRPLSFVEPANRHKRPAEMTGRQWKKYRKAEGIHEKSR